jgi:hypothetical protein
MSRGASFDWKAIRSELDSSEYEADHDNPGVEVRRVWLGSSIALNPSGKFYLPFACSNVAGDCSVCGGSGWREPRTGRRIRKRAARRQRDFSRGTVKRGCMGVPAAQRYAQRVQGFRDVAFLVANTTCNACNGMGSISAARDEAWTERLDANAEKIGAYIDYFDGDIFVVESRDVEETEEEPGENAQAV